MTARDGMLSRMGDHVQHESVRRSYDAVAEEYAARLFGEIAEKPLDRALLAALLEQAAPDAPIADLGCGPGTWRRGSPTVARARSGSTCPPA
jgi:hypothetical protein